jgi:plasmid stability protein
MTLRLTEEEQDALKACAADYGISMQDAARQAIREYIIRVDHRSRVSGAADLIMSVHADAIERLGQ